MILPVAMTVSSEVVGCTNMIVDEARTQLAIPAPISFVG